MLRLSQVVFVSIVVTEIPKIHSVSMEDKKRALSSMFMAFTSDPLARWFAPEADQYFSGGIELMEAFGGKAFENGTAYASSGYGGVSFWFPPGVEADEDQLNKAIENLVPSDRLDDVLAVFEAMEKNHPEEECWYLPLIGVDPAYQGKGLGSVLMKHVLAIIDESGLPAYLESSNPQNISLYERHGFEVVGKIQIGGSPPVHPMLRSAR